MTLAQADQKLNRGGRNPPPPPELRSPKKPSLNRVKPKKKGFRTLKMLYFLKIRLYLHTETDYLTK